MASSNPIIYQNAEVDVILIDIPTSIAAAHGDREGVLLSTTPLEAPIEPKEDYRPKAKKPRANENQAQSPVNTQHVGHRSSPHATVAEASQHDFQSLHLDDLRYKILSEHALSQIRA